MIYIFIIISIAYLTLFERKLLAIGQRRIGPNIIGYYGLLQPLWDGIKLLIKDSVLPNKTTKLTFLLSPIVLFYITLIIWLVIPFSINIYILQNSLDILYIIALSSLNIYGILYGGFFSHSKYSFISALRANSQLIAYEMNMGIALLNIINISESLSLYSIFTNNFSLNSYLINIINIIIFLISILGETNRTPFDLLEAESELVAGYLTEYSSVVFVLYYLAEYNMILFWSIFINTIWNIHFFFIFSIIILLRGILPRYRYDQLIFLSWFILLPLAITSFFLHIFLSFILY